MFVRKSKKKILIRRTTVWIKKDSRKTYKACNIKSLHINIVGKVTEIPPCIVEDLDYAAIDLEVIDIDFSLLCDKGSKVEFIPRRPNCIRVKLSNICVKFAAKILDANCKILKTFCFSVEYLPCDETDPAFDEETNPVSVTIELYAPYGVSYINTCDCHSRCCCDYIPAINFLGFIEGEDGNNSVRQGVNVQALAKIIELNTDENLAAIGLTLYLKTIYFVQYKLCHKGLCVPPKCVPVEDVAENACLKFVEGDLLEQSIQPLEICQKPKSFKCSFPVEDPTPAEDVVDEDKHKKCPCKR